MKNKIDKMCKTSEGGTPKQDQFYREDYFKCPVYFFDKPEWIKDLNKASEKYIGWAKKNNAKNIKERTKKFGNKGDHTMIHHSQSLIGDPKFKIFQDYIGASAYNLLTGQGFDLSNHQIFLTELWVQEFAKDGGGHHSLHTHWNGHISGFYFLKASEKTSRPVFQDPRAGRMMNLLPEKDTNKITDASNQIFYTVKPGRLIFFNSYLPHMYLVDSGYEPFRFIHFNLQAFPKPIVGFNNVQKK